MMCERMQREAAVNLLLRLVNDSCSSLTRPGVLSVMITTLPRICLGKGTLQVLCITLLALSFGCNNDLNARCAHTVLGCARTVMGVCAYRNEVYADSEPLLIHVLVFVHSNIYEKNNCLFMQCDRQDQKLMC